jgi:hypothetical protein
MGDEAQKSPIGRDVWGDTRLNVPEGAGAHGFRELLTDRTISTIPSDANPGLWLGDIFARLPVALLVEETG